MKRWLLWLLVFSTFVHGADLMLPDHDEVLEAVSLGMPHPGSPHGPSHENHDFCNHSCHAGAHTLAMTAAETVRLPAAHCLAHFRYASRSIPLEPVPPPTHPPNIA